MLKAMLDGKICQKNQDNFIYVFCGLKGIRYHGGGKKIEWPVLNIDCYSVILDFLNSFQYFLGE